MNCCCVVDAASKHALEAFFESLRSEVVDFGVHVTLICPGYINTQLSVNAVTGDGAKYGGIYVTRVSSLLLDFLLIFLLLCSNRSIYSARNVTRDGGS